MYLTIEKVDGGYIVIDGDYFKKVFTNIDDSLSFIKSQYEVVDVRDTKPTQEIEQKSLTIDNKFLYEMLDDLNIEDDSLSNQFNSLKDKIFTPGSHYSVGAIYNDGYTVTFDALGDKDALFVICIDGAFACVNENIMVLVNGAQSDNILWIVDGDVFIGDGSHLLGDIVCTGASKISYRAVHYGKLLKAEV